MRISLKRLGAAPVFLCLILSVVAVDPPFPHISDLQVEFYETEVQITDRNKQTFGLVKESYDNILTRGIVEFRISGSKQTVIYNNDVGEIIEVNGTNCQKWGIDESIYSYQAIYYGWLNKDPIVIGPSAMLWVANAKRKDIKYTGKKTIRNVQCDSYTLLNKGPNEDVVLTYYFADSQWESPFHLNKLIVPIRVEAKGTLKDSSNKPTPINLSTDFLYFDPTSYEDTIFQPPLGIGCPLKELTIPVPKIPKEFKLTAEVTDVYDFRSTQKVLTYEKMWYDGLRRMARLDKHTADKYISELYDFDTGVTYSTVNGTSCQIKPLRNSFFEVTDNNLIGRLKEPEEVLSLDGTFYYMGKRAFRGLWCDCFESVQTDTTFMYQDVSKLVVTVFFARPVHIFEVDGETETDVPVYYMVTGYKDNEKIINKQYNLFEFDDVIWPPMYASYRLERCFPSSADKSYFVLFMNVREDLAKKMASEESMVRYFLRSHITKHAKISDMRIAALSIDFKPTTVIVTGLMLNRPPALTQFFMEYEGNVKVAEKDVTVVPKANDEETCAYECVGNDDFLCKGFYFCGKACFLKSKGIFEKPDPGEDLKDFGNCKTWLRVTRDSTNREPFLQDALNFLEDAVLKKEMKLQLLFQDKTEEVVPIENIQIGEPYIDGPPFPHMSDMEFQFYETEVNVVDLNEKVFATAKEYYDSTGLRGKLELKAVGSMQSIYYDNSNNEILEVNETNCKSWEVEESQYDYIPEFYGWLNKNPLIIGPSAALWIANEKRNDIMYTGKTRSRGILCDTYKLRIRGPSENVTLTYYFAVENWVTPFQVDNWRVPIRIDAKGTSLSQDTVVPTPIEINIETDFSYFRPTISDWLIFQPPLGLGCPLRKSATIPTMPKKFRFIAEVFDVMKTDPENPEYTYDVEYQEVWYDSKRRIARLDKYSRTSYFSELYDFNTGVTYSTEDDRNCRIKPLTNSFFEAYDSHVIGHLKEPEEVLSLDGKFYSMGKRRFRGIWCDSFESVQTNVTFMKQNVSKLVVSIFYSQDYFKVQVDGEFEVRVPVFYMVTGYKNSKTIINLQYNIFEFVDAIWPDMYTTYSLGRCFPSVKDKSYFVLLMNVGKEVVEKMKSKDNIIKELLRVQITKHANISDMRIQLLSMDYKSNGIRVTGLMLDRPPVLKQFIMEYEGEVEVADKYMKGVSIADTEEKCASACVDNDDFTCMGFYFCKKGGCALKSKGIFDKKEDDEVTKHLEGTCKTWIRVTRDSNNDEPYLVDALKSLEDAVIHQEVKIDIGLDEKTEKIIPINEIMIGEGPYTGIGQDEPYDIIISFVKLDVEVMTTIKVEYVDNVNDCYKACKESGSLACASFSFCPSAVNKQCMLTSTLFIDRRTDPEGVKEDNNCYIYSLKYLELYELQPGRVSLLTGEDSFKPVDTTEECARKCRESTKVKCRGFEYCSSDKSCVLHARHILDLKKGEIDTVDKKHPCVHYAAKFTSDYDDMGYTLLDDDSDVRGDLTLEECAKICSEELKSSCLSFNYCPQSQPYLTDSSCALSSRILHDSTLISKDQCHHFEKKKVVDDWKKPPKKTVIKTSGYTSRGFAGLVIGMLALGLLIGSMSYRAYTHYRSKPKGGDVTVKYTKEKEIELS